MPNPCGRLFSCGTARTKIEARHTFLLYEESVRQARFVHSPAGIGRAPAAPSSLSRAFFKRETASLQCSRTYNAYGRCQTPAARRCPSFLALPYALFMCEAGSALSHLLYGKRIQRARSPVSVRLSPGQFALPAQASATVHRRLRFSRASPLTVRSRAHRATA